MPVYLLTNKVTHARAVVIANNEDEARRMHPTCEGARRDADDRGWSRTRYRSTHSTYTESVPPPTGWPLDVSLVHADEVARDCTRMWTPGHGGGQVLAYEDSTDLRVGPPNQEGPDPTWGGYTIERLRTHEDT